MPDAVNLLKFLAIRPSVLYDLTKKSPLMVSDGRLWMPPLFDVDRSVSGDLLNATQCYPAKFVLDRIQTLLPLCQTSKDVRTYSNMLAEDVRMHFGMTEKPGMTYLHDIPELIATHAIASDFDRGRLVSDLEALLRRSFSNVAGLTDYVYRNADNGSHFCIALANLLDHLYTMYVIKRVYPLNLEFVLAAIRGLNVVFCLAEPPTSPDPDNVMTACAPALLGRPGAVSLPVADEATLARLMRAEVTVHPLFAYLIAYYRPFNILRPVGVGDLKVVKQWICKYEAGEIAHIENVLLGESKGRVHRVLDRSELISTFSEENSEETTNDLETADRFELSKEVETTMQEELSAELSGTVSGSYGVTQFSVSAGVAYSQSASESTRSNCNFAKDVLSKAASRIERRVRNERKTTVLSEREETNSHGFDNKEGTGHVVGVYRWLDKRYKAQVFNYGKRLMFEVLVPEPAAFLRHAAVMNTTTEVGPTKPVEPPRPNIAISSVDQTTIDKYSALYALHDLEPEPARIVRHSTTLQQSGLPASAVHMVQLAVPEGYHTKEAEVVAAGVIVEGKTFQLTALIAGGKASLWPSKGSLAAAQESKDTINFAPVSTAVSVSVHAYNVFSYSMNIVLTCERTDEHHRGWQIKTYDRIFKAYEDLLAKHEAALTAYERRRDAIDARKSLQIRGMNPKINEQMIRTELKKHGITMIAREFDTDTSDDTTFDAMSEPAIGVPAIDIGEVGQESPLVQFLEQAFEWPQLTYLLFPYFWGKRDRWVPSQTAYADPDPLFGRFLQAGYARLLIPVRPAYEGAVLHFLYTREPWNGGPVPGIYDPLYVSIHQEIRDQQDDLQNATPEGAPWDVVVPTSLVHLQKSADLPTFVC